MDYLSLIGISVGLAMDAFAVSITNGTAYRRCRVTQALKIACAFGLFQALMQMCIRDSVNRHTGTGSWL